MPEGEPKPPEPQKPKEIIEAIKVPTKKPGGKEVFKTVIIREEGYDRKGKKKEGPPPGQIFEEKV